MSDSGGTRLTVDDDELHPRQPVQNPLAPYGYERVGDGYYPPLPPGVNHRWFWQTDDWRPYASGLPKLAEQAGGRQFTKPSDVFGAAAEAAGKYGSHLAHGLWQAGPGTVQQVMTGELQPGTREFNEAAANTALAYGALGTPIPRPAGSLGMFGGIRSKTAPREKLKEAQAMDDLAQQRMKEEFRPYYAEDFRDPIFEHTGWAKSPDGTGAWNYIIPDAGAELINLDHPKMRKVEYKSVYGDPTRDKTWYTPESMFGSKDNLTVGDILKHDYLYKAYPDLKDIKVQATGPFDSSLGGYSSETNTLYLGHLTKDDMLSVMLHELQHAIQQREGWARGGNTAEFLPPDFAKTKAIADRYMGEMNDELRAQGINPYTFRKYHGIGEHAAPDREYIRGAELKAIEDASTPEYMEQYRAVVDNYHKHMDMRDEAFRKYEALIGETQSRATQAMHHAQRWDRPAWEIGELQFSSDGSHKIVPYTPTQQQIYRPQRAPPPPRPRPGPPVGNPGNPPISLDPL